MKKLISCLLVVMMLFSVASTAAFAAPLQRVEKSDVLRTFLNETDLQTQDIALQSESGDEATDLVIRVDGGSVHLVSRNNGVEDGHIQLNPTGIYLADADSVTLLRYATVTTVMQNIVNELNEMLEQTVQNIPEEQLPTEAEVKEAVNQMAILAAAVEAQEQADAATLNSAAMAFASKFKPEYILNVIESEDGVLLSLRSEALATALAEAMDELMMNPALAELVDRHAALEGGMTFAQAQAEWLLNREATLEAIRSIKSIETLEENGHYQSHFQIGEELSAVKILICETDAWIDTENGNAQAVVALGFKNEEPLMVYEFAVDPYSYWEKLSSGDSLSEVYYNLENNRVKSGKIITVVEGNEELRADFGSDYLYVKGPKGGISTSVRETWTGKIRYELVAETAEGEQANIILDFYQDDDSLVCELYSDNDDQSATFKISRVDKITIEDLSASEKITEITASDINAALEGLLKMALPRTGSKSGKF